MRTFAALVASLLTDVLYGWVVGLLWRWFITPLGVRLKPNTHSPTGDVAGKLKVTKVDDSCGGPTIHGVRIAE